MPRIIRWRYANSTRDLQVPSPVTDLRYPIGKYDAPAAISAAQRGEWIADIAAAPAALGAAVRGLSPDQLDTPYRPGGWTVRQVVHHLPDSHLHAYVRFKLALTEESPIVKPYDEVRWAELPDTALTPPDVSLALLEALHARWVVLMRAMTPEQFARRFHHPEHQQIFTLEEILGSYAWHGKHHTAHITALRQREGW